MLSLVTTNCVVEAARAYQVPIAAVVGILRAEGGKVGTLHRNPDGSVDYGPMQVNSTWLPTLSRVGITPTLLRDDGCLNVAVGAWILRSNIIQNSGSLWAGIGAYHSAHASLSHWYQMRVYHELVATPNFTETIDAANP